MSYFNITGMNCAACSSNIERTVKKISGVNFCTVSLITGRMEVSGDFSPDSVIQAVRKLGYGISVIGDNESYDYSLKGLSPSLAPMIKRFLWSLVFLLPLMYLTMGHHLFGWPVGSYYTLNIDQLAYAELILASVIMAINIRLFLKGLTGLLELKPNMESLVAIGVGAAFMYSTMKVFQMNVYLSLGRYNLMESTVNSLYYESSAMLLTIVSFGRILENFARNKATREIRLLLNRAPKTAHRVLTDDDGYTPADGSPTILYLKNLVTEDIDASTLTRGDVFIVKTGEIIPADAVVLAGRCSIDESAISGEPLPRDVEPGMHVIGSTINTSGIISCRTERSGAETIYSQIVSMVCRAISDKAPIASIADRVSAIFVPAVIVLSIITFICWFLIFNYGITTSLKYAVSVLLVSCPCALGLATPIAITVATGKGLRSGLLFKTATALENLGKISNIALDKTGTLTSGKLTVGKITSLNSSLTEEDIIYLAAVMESGSCHPLAGAIKDTAVKMTGSLSLPDEVIINRISDYLVSSGNGNHISRIAITSLTETPGFGIRARINDVPFTIGRPASLLNSGAYSNSDRVESVIRNLSHAPMVALASAKEIIGIIEFQDQIKNKSEIAIAGLYKMGINPVMLTGDNKNSAKSVAASLDIINVMAGLLPGQKGEIIKQLRSSGLTAMAGDGINDALPLTLADVGISFNNGTDIAVNSADVIISGDNILGINKAVHLSRKTISVIKQNLFWALCYNVIGIPLAAGLFSSYGYRLTPMFAAACMSFSSILVIINALRLYLVNLSDEAVIKYGKNELKKIRTDRKSYFAEWTKTHKSIDIGMEKTDQTQVFPAFTGDDINSFSGNSSENITSTDCDPDVISNDNNSVKCNKCSADGDNNNSVSDSPDIRKSHDFRKYANTDSHKDKTDELNHDDIPVKTKENSLIFGKIFRFQKKTSDTDSAAKHADVSDGKGSSPENTGRNAATNTDSAEKTANLIIDGMMCEHCEQTVKKILEGTPHVNKVLVSRSRNAAVVLYNGSLDESAIKQKIHDAGFNLLRIMY